MQVKLVSHSVVSQDFFEEHGKTTPQDLIAFCARVSNPKNQNNKATADKLIKFLIDHKHWSPLEMVSACCEIVTTRDIARQILRHRSFSFQEFSQRYSEAQDFEFSEARLQDTKNRQNSLEVEDDELQEWWRSAQQYISQISTDFYQQALDRGIAKEVARKVLPEGLTVSRMYMQGTLRSWVHYLQLRMGKETQKEHREVAFAIAECIVKVFPLIENQIDPEKY